MEIKQDKKNSTLKDILLVGALTFGFGAIGTGAVIYDTMRDYKIINNFLNTHEVKNEGRTWDTAEKLKEQYSELKNVDMRRLVYKLNHQ